MGYLPSNCKIRRSSTLTGALILKPNGYGANTAERLDYRTV